VRTLRASVPAAVAALLWVASAGVELVSHGVRHPVVRGVDHFLAPETLPVDHLTAAAPWGVVLPGLSALALAGAYAALLALVRVRHRAAPATTAVAAYWMAAVIAGVAVAAVPVVADVAGALSEGAVPSGIADVDGHPMTAAHWGVVWGWVPAVVARLLDRTAPPPGARLLRAGMGALVLLAAAVGLVLASSAAANAGALGATAPLAAVTSG